jgi:outer membrane protein assembly factor BamB
MRIGSSWLVLVMATATGVLAGDWTEFRGPTGQGLAEVSGLPAEWGPDKNVAWKVSVDGKGWSSPVVLGKKIFLTTAVPKGQGQLLRALCLDAANGMTLWDELIFEQADGGCHSKNSHASATPVTDGTHLFVHFGTHGTACLDLNGQIVWKTNEIRYNPVHGNGGSPVLVEGKLIFSCDGGDTAEVVALDQKTGDVAWKTPRPANSGKKFAFSTPLAITVKGKTQVVSAGASTVAAYDPKTGAEIWRVRYPGGYSVVPRPVFGHGLVYLSTGYDQPSILAVRPDGKGDVTATHVAWKFSRSAPKNPSPILVGDELYLVSDNGVLTCVDAKSGKEHWQQRLGGDFSASPIFADDKLYFLNEEGEGFVIQPGKTYKELARNALEERTLASFAVVDQSLLIRTESHLYRMTAK